MELFKSIREKTKLCEIPFKHFELSEPLTNEAIQEICKADIPDPRKEKLSYPQEERLKNYLGLQLTAKNLFLRFGSKLR